MISLALVVVACWILQLSSSTTSCWAWTTTTTSTTRTTSRGHQQQSTLMKASISTADSWFTSASTEGSTTASTSTLSIDQLKVQILQLGAALDRGQAYNPTSGSYYKENVDVARSKIQQLLDQADPTSYNSKIIEGNGW